MRPDSEREEVETLGLGAPLPALCFALLHLDADKLTRKGPYVDGNDDAIVLRDANDVEERDRGAAIADRLIVVTLDPRGVGDTHRLVGGQVFPAPFAPSRIVPPSAFANAATSWAIS